MPETTIELIADAGNQNNSVRLGALPVPPGASRNITHSAGRARVVRLRNVGADTSFEITATRNARPPITVLKVTRLAGATSLKITQKSEKVLFKKNASSANHPHRDKSRHHNLSKNKRGSIYKFSRGNVRLTIKVVG